jgi:dihydrodipicolinate synthase/N-acetylneuraminate lyase
VSSPRGLSGGIVCSLITPFDADETVDLEAFGRLIDWQIAAGVHGLFVLGTAGEGLLLEAEERREAAAFAIERAQGRVPVAVHCGAPDTKTTASLAGHAASAGADAVAIVCPYYFAYDKDSLVEHFTSVARAAVPVPVYLYDNPERVGYSLDFGMVHELVRTVENIRGVKDTGDSVARVTRYETFSDPSVEVYTGNNLTVLPALVMGAQGSVSAMASAFPELFVAIYELWLKGDIAAAVEVQLVAAKLQSVLDGLPYVGGIKYLARRRGQPSGGMRSPLPDADGVAAVIDERMESLGDTITRWAGGMS